MPDKPKFYNTPPEQNEEAKQAIQEAERSEKRAKEKEERRKAEWDKAHPYEWVKTAKSWLLGILVAYTVISLTVPALRWLKYNMMNSAEIEFTKANPKLVQAMREYRNHKIETVDKDIIEAFKP